MTKTKWYFLFTESFFPFLFLLAVFLGGLLIVDNQIENRDDVLIINLNKEDLSSDDEPSIAQNLDLKDFPENTRELVTEINQYIENQSWVQAINKIKILENRENIQNTEMKLTLAYLYFKTGGYQKGLNTLNKLGPESGSRYYYNMGLLLGRQPDHYLDAIKNFEKFLEFKNNSYEANLNIGHIYFHMEKYENALKYYLKSAELSSLSRKSRAFFNAAHSYEKLNKSQKSLEYLNLAIKVDPENVKARAHRAELELKTNPDKAVGDLVKLTVIYPEYIDSYHILATYYMENDKDEKALNWMKTGLKQAPNSTRIRSNLGSIYLKLGEFEKASEIFQELSNQFPEDYLYSFNLARAYYGLNNLEKAIFYYNRAILAKPQYYEAFVNMGIVYAKLNNADQAIYYYNKALDLEKTSSGIYFNLGILYGRLDQKQNAIEAYKKAISLRPDFSEAYYNTGLIYSSMSRFSKAEEAYLNAIKINKNYTSAYNNLGFIYKNTKNKEKAIRILEQGILTTKSSKLKNRLAGFYLDDNQIEKAEKLYTEVVNEDPENKIALIELAEIFLNKKDFKQSLKFVKKYIFLSPKSARSRYINMVALYQTNQISEAEKQYQVLQRISPNYKNSEKYRDLIKKKLQI